MEKRERERCGAATLSRSTCLSVHIYLPEEMADWVQLLEQPTSPLRSFILLCTLVAFLKFEEQVRQDNLQSTNEDLHHHYRRCHYRRRHHKSQNNSVQLTRHVMLVNLCQILSCAVGEEC